MKRRIESASGPAALTTELLILPDGRILVHNLTREFAKLLRELSPNDREMISRATHHQTRITPHEFPD